MENDPNSPPPLLVYERRKSSSDNSTIINIEFSFEEEKDFTQEVSKSHNEEINSQKENKLSYSSLSDGLPTPLIRSPTFASTIETSLLRLEQFANNYAFEIQEIKRELRRLKRMSKRGRKRQIVEAQSKREQLQH
ncbi:uncharacterized protein G2W53_022554 [Senna tora]|uniref:Uncharacterized protein n=1 Tax=Senna tora TaxID=362788 RepID=A0A834TPW1_9FABA|nr:uncharacterized protein G2W53_022554 [Senna tora]